MKFDSSGRRDYIYGMLNKDLRIKLGILLLVLLQIGVGGAESSFNPDPDYAQVESVRMVYRSGGKWDIHVAVLHNDEGWDHYANVWQVIDAADGEVIGERILAHPHDTEQPFTRSLTGVKIPEGIEEILIRSRCNIHEYGGKEIRLTIPKNPEIGFSLSVQD